MTEDTAHKVCRLLLRKKLITKACENDNKKRFKKIEWKLFCHGFFDVEKVISNDK